MVIMYMEKLYMYIYFVP